MSETEWRLQATVPSVEVVDTLLEYGFFHPTDAYELRHAIEEGRPATTTSTKMPGQEIAFLTADVWVKLGLTDVELQSRFISDWTTD